MKVRPLTCIYLLTGLTACGGGNNANEPPAVAAMAPTPKPLSHEEVIAAVYDSSYKVPAGFFVDERASTPQSYSLYHVKDSSISYELCTDDYDEALTWEEDDNQSRSVSGIYVDSYENNQYFEFIRELTYPEGIGNVQGATSPGFARVFKCSSINRNGVDRNLRNGYAGTLNVARLTPDSIRNFTEYLWQFAFFETSQRKVLESITVERADTVDHSLLLAFAYNQGFDQCDRIEVIDWNFSASKLTGQVTKEFRFLYSIEAQMVNGRPEKCE